MVLSNRELATVILVAVAVVALLFAPSLRRQILPALAGILKLMLGTKVLGLFMTYFAYAAAIAIAARWAGIWETAFLKDTLVVIFFVGLPLLANADGVHSGRVLVSKVVKQTIRVSAFIAFYLGLASLPLWGELLVQPLLIFLGLLAAVSSLKPATLKVATASNVLSTLIVVLLAIFTSVHLAHNWSTYNLRYESLSFAVTLWLPILLIPFVYVCAFVFHVDSILVVMPFFNERRPIRRRVKFALIAGLHLRPVYSSAFVGMWRDQLGTAQTFKVARKVMKDFRRTTRETIRAKKEHAAKLKEFAGVDGTDEDGLRLDRREFGATKRVLKTLRIMEMGWYRKPPKHYRGDLLDIVGSFAREGLPEEHGITLEVAEGKRAWRAWRATPSGWYFGVGGSRDVERDWEYDGEHPPRSFPGPDAGEWVDAAQSPRSPEWVAEDGEET